MAAAVAQFYFRCRIEWRHILHKVSVYQHTEYRQDNSIHGRDITISVFQKQTSAILELFFRLWLWPHHRYPHEILHKIAKFFPYRITYCGNMTTYRFFKMADAATKYYFRFRICWYHCFHKVRVYQQTKFHRHISIHGWDITTSVFEKKRPPYWNFTSGFDLDHFAVICMLFCIRLPNVVQIGATTAEIITSYPFFKMAAAAAQYYFRFRICWCHCF